MAQGRVCVLAVGMQAGSKPGQQGTAQRLLSSCHTRCTIASFTSARVYQCKKPLTHTHIPSRHMSQAFVSRVSDVCHVCASLLALEALLPHTCCRAARYASGPSVCDSNSPHRVGWHPTVQYRRSAGCTHGCSHVEISTHMKVAHSYTWGFAMAALRGCMSDGIGQCFATIPPWPSTATVLDQGSAFHHPDRQMGQPPLAR